MATFGISGLLVCVCVLYGVREDAILRMRVRDSGK